MQRADLFRTTRTRTRTHTHTRTHAHKQTHTEKKSETGKIKSLSEKDQTYCCEKVHGFFQKEYGRAQSDVIQNAMKSVHDCMLLVRRNLKSLKIEINTPQKCVMKEHLPTLPQTTSSCRAHSIFPETAKKKLVSSLGNRFNVPIVMYVCMKIHASASHLSCKVHLFSTIFTKLGINSQFHSSRELQSY